MKILFLARLFWPHIGGVEKHVESLSSSLRKKGHKVTVVTTKYDTALRNSVTVHGYEVIRLRQPNIKFLGLIYTWYWFWKNRSLIKESDIVHVHDVFIWYLPLRFLYPNKPTYTTFHGWEGKFPIPKKNVLQKRLAYRLSWKSISIGDYIEKHYGIESEIVSYGATSVPKRGFKKNKNSLIYVGRLEKDTGLQVLLEALSRYNDINNWNKIKIDFCGDGSMANKCRKYGKVHGFVDPTPFLRKAEICFASGYLTILEALAHQCLVLVAHDNPLKKDYYGLTPFSDSIIKTRSAYEVLDSLKYYEKHKEKARKMINKGYNWVKTQTWEKLAKQYLELWGVGEK